MERDYSSSEEEENQTEISQALADPEFERAIRENCVNWLQKSLGDFDPKGVNLYTFDELYYNDVEFSPKQQDDVLAVYKSLWNAREDNWKGVIPDGWQTVSSSIRSLILEHPDYPGYLFKFCKGSPSRGNPAAHFLRVPKGKQIRRIIDEENLDCLDVVTEQLVALKTKEEIKRANDREQCYHFVVKGIKLSLMSERNTMNTLSLYTIEDQVEIAIQIMKLICKSGLGDVGFHNIYSSKETSKLVFVDTEPLYGSLMLDEPELKENQYERTKQIIDTVTNLDCIITGLKYMADASGKLPIFKKVAQIYLSEVRRMFS